MRSKSSQPRHVATKALRKSRIKRTNKRIKDDLLRAYSTHQLKVLSNVGRDVHGSPPPSNHSTETSRSGQPPSPSLATEQRFYSLPVLADPDKCRHKLSEISSDCNCENW